jgi:WD40 repeat protein
MRARSGESTSPRTPATVRPLARTVWSTSRNIDQHRLIRIGAQDIERLAAAVVDGRWILAAAVRRDTSFAFGKGSGSLELWDPMTGSQIQTLRRRYASDVEAMKAVQMPSDALAVVGYHDNVLEAWSPRRRETVWSHDLRAWILHLHVVRSRRREALVAIVGGGDALLLDAQTGSLLDAFQTGGGVLFAVGFAASGTDVLCFGLNTGDLEFYDADSFGPLGTITPEEVWVRGVAVEVRGRQILFGALADGRIEARDAQDGRVLTLSRHETRSIADVFTVARRPAADPLLVQDDGADVALHSTPGLDGAESRHGHLADITAIEILTDAVGYPTLATAGKDGTIRTWSLAARRTTYTISTGLARQQPILQFWHAWYVPSKRQAVLAETVDDYVLLDLESGAPIQTLPRGTRTTADPEYVSPTPTGLAVLADSPMVLTYHDGRAQHLVNVLDGNHYAVPTDTYSPKAVERVVVPRTGGSPILVIGDGNTPLAVYEFTGVCLGTLPDSDGGRPLRDVHWSDRDGVLVAVGNEIRLYDIASGRIEGAVPLDRTEQSGPRVLAGVATADGRSVAVVVVGPPGSRPRLATMGYPGSVHALDADLVAAAPLVVENTPMLAVAIRNRLSLMNPGDATVVTSLPMESQILSLVACGGGRIVVQVKNCLRLVELTRLPYDR